MTETWGLLAKGQTDAQLIDEAISAAIASHEADSEAHLGSGESLQSHKSSEIIDHLIGSVLADKMSMTEYLIRTTFESPDKWVTVGNVQITDWPGAMLWSDYSPTNPAKMSGINQNWAEFVDYSKNMIFQMLGKIAETTNKKVSFGFGNISGGDPIQGFGFKIVNGTLYGYLDKSGTPATVTLTSVDLYVPHVYRAQWDATTQVLTYFVDGVQKGTISWSGTTATEDGNIVFYNEATASGESYLFAYEMFISRQI